MHEHQNYFYMYNRESENSGTSIQHSGSNKFKEL